MSLFLLAGMRQRESKAHLGMNEALGLVTGTGDVLVAFLDHQKPAALKLLEYLGIDESELRNHLSEIGETQEPQPEPIDLPPGLRDTVSSISRPEGKRPMSAPVLASWRSARQRATEQGKESFSANDVVAQLLRHDCEARSVMLGFARPDEIDGATQILEGLDAEEVDFMEANRTHLRKVLDAAWPTLCEVKGSMRVHLDEAMAKNYEEHPARYEQPLALAEELQRPCPIPEKEFIARVGTCLHAARNEARIRRAPETTLDHLLLALLQDGTATSEFLDRRGVDRVTWRAELDAVLPRFEDGPTIPPNARDLGMNIPDDGSKIRRKKDIPDNVDIERLTREERAEYFERVPGAAKFTDLCWLLAYQREELTKGAGLILSAGITADEIKCELALFESGDPDWFRKRPAIEPTYQSVATAAQFEARSRWAPTVLPEHEMLALLNGSTDTSQLVEDLGLDGKGLVQALDALLPRFASGPYFPEPSSTCNAIWLVGGTVHASDLQIVERILWWNATFKENEATPLVQLLRNAGLTLEAVQQRLREKGVEVREPLRES
ncbi:MAG: hypothetical protein JSS66_15680 [Armatimonadetes bacterium]|nr:hypothetical protein [Armatimonadota bacterium]